MRPIRRSMRDNNTDRLAYIYLMMRTSLETMNGFPRPQTDPDQYTKWSPQRKIFLLPCVYIGSIRLTISALMKYEQRNFTYNKYTCVPRTKWQKQIYANIILTLLIQGPGALLIAYLNTCICCIWVDIIEYSGVASTQLGEASFAR